MNFFEQQAAARRGSTRLVVLFALAVLGIVLAVDVAVAVVAGASPGLMLVTSLVTLGVIGLGSLYRIASLGGGGESVALQLGGVPVPEDTRDLNLRRLRNVVEEIAIASGVPVPKLYVLEHEAAINAFAAGYSPSDAVVAVTRGALDRLNRDELQGVIAHEFSHILNGDMRLNIRLVGVLFGIMMIALIGRKVMVHGHYAGRREGAVAVIVAALAAMLIGSIGLFFGRMIKAGVSRSRERLADASAVQFTRQTAGLAGALKKIGGLHDGSRLVARAEAEEVSHMLFGDGVGFRGLFATHPPLVERIRALEPGFDEKGLDALSRRWAASPPMGLEEDVQMGFAPPAAQERLQARGAEQVLRPDHVSAQVAHPGSDDYRRADTLVGAMPPALRALASDRESVVPLLLGLLMDDRAEVAAGQVRAISERLGRVVAERARYLREDSLRDLHPALRLPLASLAFPVLRLRPRPELEQFLDASNAVIHADGEVSLFEYCLARLLTVQVRESLDPARYAQVGRKRTPGVKREFQVLLSVVAQAGHADEASARRAYLAGLNRVLPRDHLPYAPPADGVAALDAVWQPLDALDPLAKQVMVEAIAEAIVHDGRVSVAEAELLRTICGVLHCPLPPMLGAKGD
ncbi:M48 family metallopeptidase [Lysobacter sp. SG-8]|uniref:M48 family metallopeptidase n=1 Tax=Marilutibacter penaei TaxID=2759900 RepID=A0A7W3YDY0_9GAMM|nr:M48 family metallopeptidase [Lysobacter penaei]MBB1088214.1 M48 family metallopeptidase [Lysobacter penaei]